MWNAVITTLLDTLTKNPQLLEALITEGLNAAVQALRTYNQQQAKLPPPAA